MEIVVARHAVLRLRSRAKQGPKLNGRRATEWIQHRVTTALSAGEPLTIIDQNGEHRTIVDLDQEVCAVLKHNDKGCIVLTVLTAHMKTVSLREGWWTDTKNANPVDPEKTWVLWMTRGGMQHRLYMPSALVPMKIGRLIKGGVDPSTICTKPPPRKEPPCNPETE